MTRIKGTVILYRTYYLLDAVTDGDVPRDDIREEVWNDVTADEARDILNRAGLSFAATGGDWAADPDGSYTVDYSTGLECETSGHLSGFPVRLHAAIATQVG